MIAMTDEIPRSPAGKIVDGAPAGDAGADLWRRLFSELASGRISAVEELYDACSRQVFGLAVWRTGSIEDASDVVQELFVKLVQRRGDLSGVANPRAWLLSVARRLAVDVIRRKKRRPSSSLEDCPLLVAAENDPGRAIDAARASRWMATLPSAQREAIYLRHFADCTFQVIGEITHVPTFTAASRYRLGMARLRKRMGGEK